MQKFDDVNFRIRQLSLLYRLL